MHSGVLSRKEWGIPLGVCVLFVGLTLGPAVWRAPFGDEGWFASAADTLVRKGHLGIAALGENSHLQRPPLLRIQTRTYWVLPAYLLTLAAWFGLFGTGLLQMRVLSILWAVCALISTYYVVRQLTGNLIVARLAIGFTAVNEVFVIMGSFGRMDMMCLATGLTGQAVYLSLRVRNMKLGLLCANALVCVGLLAHPNGIIAFIVLWLMTLILDRSRLTREGILLSAIPYLVGIALYSGYVLEDPEAFVAQIAGNVPVGRFSGVLHPAASVAGELRRWVGNYGSPPKALIPLSLVGSFVLLALQVPRDRGRQLLLAAAVIPLLLLTFFNVKLWFYLIYTAVPLASVFAAWVYDAWQRSVLWRLLALCFVLAYVAASVGLDVYRFWSLPQAFAEFTQVSAAAERQLGERETINAPAHFIFSLGFDRVLHDDSLGYYSGRRPRVYIEAKWNSDELETLHRTIPDEQAYRENLLESQYTVALETRHYRLWTRNRPA
jgi:4-amino-4-deoxy-L-arabinose transferase-like glycosyltransferase